jgi:SAM-dependent methyltransferase
MPAAYLEWRRSEQVILVEYIRTGDYVADYCCGDGRLIPVIVEKASRLEGCDNDVDAIERARTIATAFDERVKLVRCDFMSFSPKNGLRRPDISICLGNSLAALPYSLTDALAYMAQHAEREVFASVIRKGTLEIRKNYYDGLGIPYTFDVHTEVFNSPIWGDSRAYSRNELEMACLQVGFNSFEIKPVGQLGFIVIGRK